MIANKKFFVDGGILVNTPYFRYLNGGAGFDELAIPDAEPLATNRKSQDDGEYLLIDDRHPQSIFAEYYARTFFTTGYLWAPMFCKTYDACRREFKRNIEEIDILLSLSDHVDAESAHNLLLRQSIVSVMSAMDTFLADIVLTKITSDEGAFYKYAFSFVLKSEDYFEIDPETEQRVINSVLRRSFMNKQTIKETFLVLFDMEMEIEGSVEHLISNRHLLVHRCGRKKDGMHMIISRNDVSDAIKIVEGFVDKVLAVTGL